jgi:hypothetical protein
MKELILNHGKCGRCGKSARVISTMELDLPIYICVDRESCAETMYNIVRMNPRRRLVYADGIDLRKALFYRWLFNKNGDKEEDSGEGFVVSKTVSTL